MKKTVLALAIMAVALPLSVLARSDSQDLRNKNQQNWQIKVSELRQKIKSERDAKNKVRNNALAMRAGSSTPEYKGDDRKNKKEKSAGESIVTRAQRVGIYIDQLLQRIEQQIKNMENLFARVQTRIQELSTDGKDTVAIEAKLAEAQTALDAVKAQFALLPAVLDPLRASTSTKLQAGAKTAASSTIAQIRYSHARMVEAISLIKNIK